MRQVMSLACVLAATVFSTNVLAEEDGSYQNYDAIVNELKATADAPDRRPVVDNSWDEVALHAGVGIATSLVSYHMPDGNSASGLFKGVQISSGVNMFSREVRAEGVFSVYQHEDLDQSVRGDLKEFGIQLVYMPPLADNMTLRLGLGLSERFLTLNSHTSFANSTFDSSTSSNTVLLGLERKMSKSVTLGPDLAYRSALQANTLDKSSWDASIRLNATF